VSPPYVAVVGPGSEEPPAAEAVGAGIARLGCVLVCGGLGGAMAGACRGAAGAGGTTVGLLPGDDRAAGNAWLTVALATGLGELRNGLVVRAADVVVAIGESAGTLSEIGFALRLGRPVIGVETFDIAGIEAAADADAAIARVSAHIRNGSVAN
jgi:uncharacterized protein (TIGR00725 family)